MDRLVGGSNESEIIVSGVKTKALIDSGSVVTCISEEFYNSLHPKPELFSITEFGLSVHSANGGELPYRGYIELDICVPCLHNGTHCIPALVVPQTNYSKSVPVIIGTNFIRICRDVYDDSQFPEIDVPDEWKLAFDSMCDETPVKAANNHTLQIAPNETR